MENPSGLLVVGLPRGKPTRARCASETTTGFSMKGFEGNFSSDLRRPGGCSVWGLPLLGRPVARPDLIPTSGATMPVHAVLSPPSNKNGAEEIVRSILQEVLTS